MSIFFRRKKLTSSPAIDALFLFLRDQVNREDLIADLWDSWGKIRYSQPFNRGGCVALYLTFERFITENKPLVVKREYSKESLRAAVARAVNVTSLPDYIQIFFVTEEKRREIYFRIVSQVLVDILDVTEGLSRVRTIVEESIRESVYTARDISKDGVTVTLKDPSVVVDRHEWHRVVRGVYTMLYRETMSFLGEKIAHARIDETYRSIERAYGSEYLDDFFEIIPEDLFASERISYLSHAKLATEVAQATEAEHKKVEQAQDVLAQIAEQNRLLEDTKKALVNVLEDARELEEQLKIEKASVEQKVVERTRQLQEEQARFMAAINSMRRGFAIIDADAAIPVANKALGVVLDVSHERWTMDDLARAFGEAVDIRALFTKCLAEKSPVAATDLSVGRKFISVFMAPILSQEGQLIGIILNVDDITEQKVLARSRDEFFSIASHELRTPLTAIRGDTSMILEYYADKLADPQLKEMITDVHESSIRLINIVKDFLDTSRLELGKIEFKNAAFDLSELIRDALKEYQVTGSRQHIALTFAEPQEPLPPAFADSARVREVLINLIGNALKFTERGSVTVSARATEGLVQVMVTDTGRGIPIENQSLLFRKFQQAGDSLFTRDTTKGTGLGLYISKLMVEGMGGKIWLMSSEPGKGSTFTFTLPLAKL